MFAQKLMNSKNHLGCQLWAAVGMLWGLGKEHVEQLVHPWLWEEVQWGSRLQALAWLLLQLLSHWQESYHVPW